MYQNNPYYQNYNMQQNQMCAAAPQMFLKGRPVVSVDEVRTAQIDFDGSLFIFPDMTNGCIYTKQALPTGIIINKYILEEQNAKPVSSEYITKEDFNNTVSELKAMIKSNLNTKSSPPAAEFNFV